MADGYDVVIVGGGHNGLTAGCYLAKAGRRVLVLEARDVVGGGCATEEVAAPGYRHNFHSNFHGIIHMGPVYRDLQLEAHGASYVWPENQFAHVFPDGRALVCARDLETTVANVARFDKGDAATVRELARLYRQVLEEGFIPAMFSQPQPPSRDLAPLEAMGVEGLGLERQFLSAPNHVARDLFTSPEVQTWLGFWVAQLAGTGDVFGLGANYPLMLAGSLDPYGWAICVGESLDVLEDNASDCRLVVPPRRPGLFTVHPSIFDPSLCPPGSESTFCEQIAPYELRDGGSAAWEDVKGDYAATVLDRWRP